MVRIILRTPETEARTPKDKDYFIPNHDSIGQSALSSRVWEELQVGHVSTSNLGAEELLVTGLESIPYASVAATWLNRVDSYAMLCMMRVRDFFFAFPALLSFVSCCLMCVVLSLFESWVDDDAGRFLRLV